MSKLIMGFFALSLTTVVVGCAQPEEEYVVVNPEPISVEPTYTGKFK